MRFPWTFARFLALLEMTRDVLDNIYIITKFI